MARQPAILSSFTLLVANVLGERSDASLWLGLRLAVRNALWTLRKMRAKPSIPLSLKSLVAHATSSAAGCRYCQAHTVGEALLQGVPADKVEALWDFESSDRFDPAEKAALRFAIAAGSSPNAVTPESFAELKQHFTDEQIVELGAVIALFGFLNRWNDTFATELESEPKALAEKHLAGSGWTIGKHG
jgi:alkylhydroperoxidase family enzyme